MKSMKSKALILSMQSMRLSGTWNVCLQWQYQLLGATAGHIQASRNHGYQTWEEISRNGKGSTLLMFLHKLTTYHLFEGGHFYKHGVSFMRTRTKILAKFGNPMGVEVALLQKDTEHESPGLRPACTMALRGVRLTLSCFHWTLNAFVTCRLPDAWLGLA